MLAMSWLYIYQLFLTQKKAQYLACLVKEITENHYLAYTFGGMRKIKVRGYTSLINPILWRI